MDNNKIGSFIKELRENNNMSQQKLADEIPIGREAVSKWECGRTIPDSSNILRLSEIFDVTIDEIMYGEYKTKENKKEVEEVHMQIYDDRNTIKKKLKKTIKYFLIIFLLLLSVTFGLLIYYFLNSYDSVKIYTIESQTDDIYLTDGIIMLTGENIYFRLGNINGIEENKISKVLLYYKKDNDKKVIYESTSIKDNLIRDYYGYNEYFEIKNKDVVFDLLYVDIHYDNEIKTLNLIMKEDYSNKRIFFNKEEEIGDEVAKQPPKPNTELIKKIKEKFNQEEDGIYYQNLAIDGDEYSVYYIEDSLSLLISWQKDKYYHSFDYHPIYKSAFYEKFDNNSNQVEECYYEKNNKEKTTCDNSIIDKLNYLLNEIIEG